MWSTTKLSRTFLSEFLFFHFSRDTFSRTKANILFLFCFFDSHIAIFHAHAHLEQSQKHQATVRLNSKPECKMALCGTIPLNPKRNSLSTYGPVPVKDDNARLLQAELF